MQRLLYYFDGAKNIPCLVWEQLAAMARGEMVKEEVDKEDEEGVEGIIRFDSIGWAWQLPASKRRRGNILKCPILNSFCQKLAGPCLRNWSWTRILYKALSWNTKVDRSSTFIFSCPGQLNRWPCHSLTDSLTDWRLLLSYKEQS